MKTRIGLRKGPPRAQRSFWSGTSTSAAASPATELLGSSALPHVSETLLPVILAVVLASTATDEDDESAAKQDPWTVRATTKGQGAFASRNIRKGELVITERPVCIWPQGLSEQQARELFERMDEPSKRAYMALSRDDAIAKDLDDVRAIRATNGFAVQLPLGLGTAAMVFPRIARLNHSCTPNLSQAMNFSTLRMEVYAITDIAPSEELSIEYLPLVCHTRAERQQALKESFGFPTCLCPVCVAPAEQVEQSDRRRREIKAIGDSLKDGRRDRAGTMAKLDRIRVLLEQEGYKGLPEFDDTSLSNAYAVYATIRAREERPT
ncbi:hypothetical protein OIV83_005172 [Microbotryomycetes sp. JL201]|nr:hypothetical protein OIV83_005172 [Microbotryomycetes sp. JL201]